MRASVSLDAISAMDTTLRDNGQACVWSNDMQAAAKWRARVRYFRALPKRTGRLSILDGSRLQV